MTTGLDFNFPPDLMRLDQVLYNLSAPRSWTKADLKRETGIEPFCKLGGRWVYRREDVLRFASGDDEDGPVLAGFNLGALDD